GAPGDSAHAAGGKIPCPLEMLARAAGADRRRGAPAAARAHAGGEGRHAARVRDLRLEARRAQRALVGGLSERGRNMRRLHAFNFQSWIKENQHLLKPPVGNKKVFEDGEMTVQVVGGPNERTDYHDDPVEEFFYQLKGDMLLKVVDNGNFYDVPIREGEVFLLPAHVRHCPQRPREGSVGLVVEAARPDELDAFEWYCFECRALVHRRGESAAPGEGPAAALRGLLRRRKGAQVQELRRHSPWQAAAARVGKDLTARLRRSDISPPPSHPTRARCPAAAAPPRSRPRS